VAEPSFLGEQDARDPCGGATAVAVCDQPQIFHVLDAEMLLDAVEDRGCACRQLVARACVRAAACAPPCSAVRVRVELLSRIRSVLAVTQHSGDTTGTRVL
jgi:hypothetical protein